MERFSKFNQEEKSVRFGAVRNFLVPSATFRSRWGCLHPSVRELEWELAPRLMPWFSVEMGGRPTLGWWWAVALSGRVQVPLGLFHKWGKEGVRIWQIDWCGICSKVDAVMACCGKESVLSLKTKLSIYQSVCALTLICGHKLWLVTKRVRSKYLSSSYSRGSTASLWHCLLDISLVKCFEHVRLGGGTGVQPGHTGDIMSLGWFKCTRWFH